MVLCYLSIYTVNPLSYVYTMFVYISITLACHISIYTMYVCMSDIANLPLSQKAAKSHGYQDANECLKLFGGELRLSPVITSGFGVTIQILTLPL